MNTAALDTMRNFKYTKMSIVLPHSEEFSFEGVSVDTYFTFRLTTTGTCGFSRKLKIVTIDEDTESSR
jgi:hypothetical protein